MYVIKNLSAENVRWLVCSSFNPLLKLIFMSRKKFSTTYALVPFLSQPFNDVYTCDEQVLWESAGAFFPRDNSLVSDRKSHSLNLWPWQLLAVGQLPALVATSGTWLEVN